MSTSRGLALLLACVVTGGLIGLLIGPQAAQALGVLLALTIIVAMATLPTRNL